MKTIEQLEKELEVARKREFKGLEDDARQFLANNISADISVRLNPHNSSVVDFDIPIGNIHITGMVQRNKYEEDNPLGIFGVEVVSYEYGQVAIQNNDFFDFRKREEKN